MVFWGSNDEHAGWSGGLVPVLQKQQAALPHRASNRALPSEDERPTSGVGAERTCGALLASRRWIERQSFKGADVTVGWQMQWCQATACNRRLAEPLIQSLQQVACCLQACLDVGLRRAEPCGAAPCAQPGWLCWRDMTCFRIAQRRVTQGNTRVRVTRGGHTKGMPVLCAARQRRSKRGLDAITT
eukprot:355368-Chlamydomonas_euryale.AAC.13